jgi:two-component system, LytTR family, response regulator
MIKAIAIDDEPPALSILESFCSGNSIISLEKTFTRTDEALKFLRKYPVDLIFLDIQMPSVSGIEFLKLVEQNTMIVFTTAFSEYAVEGFNLNAVDFLLKPFSKVRFEKTIEKIIQYRKLVQSVSVQDSGFLFIRADYSLIKVCIADILYVEGLDDYLKIYIPNHRPIVARFTMKAMLEKLPSTEFIRVHRSFIIPLSRIKSIQKKSVDIGERTIPIGLSYQKSFFEQVKK